MSEQKTRLCKYGCGTELYWDNAARAYMEVKLRRTHKGNCSKFKDFKQTAAKVEQEISSGKSPTTLQGLTEDMVNLQGWKASVETRLLNMEKAIRDFGEVIAKDSYKKASEIPKKDEEVVQEE